MLGLYVGVIAVIWGIYTYKPPAGIWPEGKAWPVSPAVQCTTILTCQYFVLYALVAFSRTWSQFTGQRISKFENAMLTATNAMNFAPMLCILFIGARMRALQMDPVNGNPQRWAQICFYACAYSVLVQLCLIFAVPLVLGGSVEHEKGAPDGDVTFKLPEGSDMMLKILLGVRWAVMLALYA